MPLTEEVLRFHAVKISGHGLVDWKTMMMMMMMTMMMMMMVKPPPPPPPPPRGNKYVNNKCDSHLCFSHAPNVESFTRVCYRERAKTIARFFPHSARDLEPAIKTLRRFMPKRDGTAAKYEVAGFWDRYRPETRETLTKEVASESFF